VITLDVVAFVAVWRFRVGVIPVVTFCAAVGLAAALVNRA
jgi:hypothetical protein